MSIPFSNTNYRIPQGFANLLEGLTKEVLRHQPKDIPLFGAKYFTQLLQQRQETDFDPAQWGAALEVRFYNNDFQNESFRKPQDEAIDIPLDDPDANAAAAKIQAGFRGHMTRKKMKSGEKDLKSKDSKDGSSTGGENEGD
ncbi:sperm surface protein Sp17 [Xenopus laevis]|uniref:Sperm surface protein Sp17 n=1 Tax=Xenopus laevis TaxID=8355 RepID=A0A8J0U6E8_XENLA|nr:sperm surface protein Sp17 [Xenopus laevis]OCT57177.1 hypothetical protein XELAEV_18003875mg [Xenopus laevis]